MQGQFKEYNWDDIKRLIFEDAGLQTEVDQRTRGEMWYIGGFSEPQHSKDTCVRLQVYDKVLSDRMKEHAGV